MKKLLVIVFTLISSTLVSQFYFYGGYQVGKFFAVEAPFDNLSTKFNLGWDAEVSNDKGMFSFKPGGTSFVINKTMDYHNIPHGFVFGTHMKFESKFGCQIGMNFLNNSVSGSRLNQNTGFEEKLSFKSRTAGFSINFTYAILERFQPLFGVDMGLTKTYYSFENGVTTINKQLLGYRTKGLSIGTIVGDKELVFSMNTGVIISVLKFNKFQMNFVPNAQFRLSKSTKIDQGLYYPLLFNHSNYSCSIWLTYEI